MKEAIVMWRNTRMIILTALCAAVYAAGIIPLKGIILIPGITELRPAAVFPIVFGLLFGPAGAWGAAIGNTIADVNGTLGPGTLFGFVGNFYLAFLMYKLWGSVWLVPSGSMDVTLDSPRKIAAYGLITAVASTVCAVIIAGCLKVAGIVPFTPTATAIVVNNLLAGAILGPLLLGAIYPFVKRMGLLWTQILRREDVAPGFARQVGAMVVAFGGFGGLLAGISLEAVFLSGDAATAAGQQRGFLLSMLPFLLLIVLGGFLLSGREQFPKEEAADAADAPAPKS